MQAVGVDEVRGMGREFAAAELRPHVEAWDAARRLPAELLRQIGEMGFLGMLVPEAHGGLGLDLPAWVAAIEELSWGEPAVGLTVSIHGAYAGGMILARGSEAQRERWLGPLAGGEALGCFALAEAGAGSDAGAVATRARREGDGWVLDGAKKWVTNGGVADLAVVVARTAEGAGGNGLSVFLVPTDTEGYRVTGREATLGLRSLEFATVALTGVRVPAGALLGEEGAGYRLVEEAHTTARLGVAAQAVGIAQAALEHAIRYAAEREQFGQPLRAFEAIQFKLADMATRVAAARSLLGRAAAEPSSAAASMAKLFASEAAMAVTTEAVQIFGGYGYMRDYPVEKLMRDAKGTEIYEGTNELLRVIIASGLYG
jgi:alkylation response protein AidB-like acyl-CoA dehydrogenase